MGVFSVNIAEKSDEDLMREVAKGDSKSFNVIYERYAQRLMGYFWRMLWKDREKAEDFVHDIFAKIVERPELYNPERPFKTWIFSVANNMCKNEYRKQSIRQTKSSDLSNLMHLVTSGDSPDLDSEKSLFREALAIAMENLDEKHKTVFILRYKMNLSVKEVSESMGISEGTVKSRLFYALKKLAVELEDFKPENLKENG
jgi:RNA polymerase sigma-70 factor (ECF subfamily)